MVLCYNNGGIYDCTIRENIMKENSNNADLKSLTKDAITKALLFLMDEKDYKDISITDVCKKAGVSRNAFYRNYDAKDAILRRYLYEITDKWRKTLHTVKNLTSLKYFTSLFTQCYNFKDIIRKVIASGTGYLLVDLFFTVYADRVRNTPAPKYTQCQMAGSIHAICIHWIMNNQPETPEELAQIVCKLNRVAPNARMRLSPDTDIETLMTSGTFTYNE